MKEINYLEWLDCLPKLINKDDDCELNNLIIKKNNVELHAPLADEYKDYLIADSKEREMILMLFNELLKMKQKNIKEVEVLEDIKEISEALEIKIEEDTLNTIYDILKLLMSLEFVIYEHLTGSSRSISHYKLITGFRCSKYGAIIYL